MRSGKINGVYLVIIISVVVTILVAIFTVHAYTKLTDLRYRFQLVELRAEKNAKLLAGSAEAYQAQRGSAELPVPKVEFPFGATGTWQRLKDWEADKYEKTKALAVYDDDLWVGLGAHDGATATISRYDGQNWNQATYDEATVANPTSVHVLFPFQGKLLAGVDHMVLSKDGPDTSFRAVPNLPWSESYTAYAMAALGETLYVGLNSGDRPRVFALSEAGWSEISDGLPAVTGGGVYELHEHSDGHVYASLALPVGPTEIYRLADREWRKIGGDGHNGSWVNEGFHYALSMSSYKDHLIVSMSRRPMVHGNFTSIWAYDGREWRPIAPRQVPAHWGQMHNYNSTFVYRDHLLVGGGGHPPGNASIWAYRPAKGWKEVAGHNAYESWGGDSRERLSDSRHSSGEYVYRMVEWRGTLIAGFGLSPGMAQIWQYTPPDAAH